MGKKKQPKPTALRIVELRAENVKRLKAVHIKPEGDVIVIGGDNAQGKSSVIDSIAYALGGRALCPAQPIRKGTERATVGIDLGELVVNRVFTAKGSRLEVMKPNGVPAKSPQALLDSLTSKLTFDPLEFAWMSEPEQVETLKGLVGLDFANLDGEREELYARRREINREAKMLEGQLNAMGAPENVPDALVDLDELGEKLEEAMTHNHRCEQLRCDLQDATAEVGRAAAALADAQAAIADANARRAALTEEVRKTKGIDTTAIREEMAQAQEKNTAYLAAEMRKGVADELAARAAASGDATRQMAEIDQQKAKAVQNAKFPIKGLSFGAGVVLYNDVPLTQASHAERIQISAAVGLAMHPKLRILLIRGGEKLDAEHRKTLAAWAKQNDAQLWIEDCRSEENGEATVVIEDGSVKEG